MMKQLFYGSLFWIAAQQGFAFGGQTKEYILKVPSFLSFEKKLSELQSQKHLQVLSTHPVGRLILVRTAEQKKAMLQKDSDYVVDNIRFHALEDVQMPSSAEEKRQWALDKVQATKAWELTQGHRDVVVAVIDTGVDGRHSDLAQGIWKNTKEIPGNGIDDDQNGFIDDVAGWDFRDNDADPMDETSDQNPGHGTHCAGIVAGHGDGSTGVLGMGPGLSIMPIRFLGSDGSGDLMAAAQAIDYAVINGAHVISASWGAEVPESEVKPILEAISRAERKGIPFVAAASNDGKSNDRVNMYPANAHYSNVISVAASDSQDKKPRWSNYGRKKVDLVSPGADIFSTLPNQGYGHLSGTSMATPLVAGLVGLLIHQSQLSQVSVSPKELKAILQASGDRVSIETACQCRVNAFEAVQVIAHQTPVLVPGAASLKVHDTLPLSVFSSSQDVWTFHTSDSEVGEVSADGVLTAKKAGDLTIYAERSDGTKIQSLPFLIFEESQTPPAPPVPNGCPFEEVYLCQIYCMIDPSMPWCE